MLSNGQLEAEMLGKTQMLSRIFVLKKTNKNNERKLQNSFLD